MGWLSTDTRTDTEKFEATVTETKEKAGKKQKTSKELLEKVSDHYEKAKGHIYSITITLADLTRLKIKYPKGYSNQSSKQSSYDALVDDHIMAAIHELGKVFAYVIKTYITDTNSTSLHAIKGVVLDSMILFNNNNNKLSNANMEFKNSINIGLLCPSGETILASICELCEEAKNMCPTNKTNEIKKMTPIMEKLYDEAIKKLEPLLPALPPLQRKHRITSFPPLGGGKRKTRRKALRKTHNKKKTYMKLACKCTIRKARK